MRFPSAAQNHCGTIQKLSSDEHDSGGQFNIHNRSNVIEPMRVGGEDYLLAIYVYHLSIIRLINKIYLFCILLL